MPGSGRFERFSSTTAHVLRAADRAARVYPATLASNDPSAPRTFICCTKKPRGRARTRGGCAAGRATGSRPPWACTRHTGDGRVQDPIHRPVPSARRHRGSCACFTRLGGYRNVGRHAPRQKAPPYSRASAFRRAAQTGQAQAARALPVSARSGRTRSWTLQGVLCSRRPRAERAWRRTETPGGGRSWQGTPMVTPAR